MKLDFAVRRTCEPFTFRDAPLSENEATVRQTLCLNGAWQFQPIAVDAAQVDAAGVPILPSPKADGWSDTPLIVPSPWNGNDWGGATNRRDPAQRYWPDGIYYPSYPAEWIGVKMGWLRRTFTVPSDWQKGRLTLHFDAVAGEAIVMVNGHTIGTHFDRYLPFEADVTDVVHEGENEVLVGVRGHCLFDLQSPTYSKMRCPFPTGSNTENVRGIWQDVYLCMTPTVYVADTFVQPLVSKNTLRLEVTVANSGDTAADVTLGGEVCRWDTGDVALSLPTATCTVEAGATATVTLEASVDGKLDYWTPDTPVLYTAELSLNDGADRRSVRFGWREFTLDGDNLLLNGEPIHLVADICHPFGPYMFTREWVTAWYRMIKDVGGNAVRLHAQIYPPVFLDVADEMGLAVLDETALFGSSLSLNLEEVAAWTRFEEHYDGLIRRDRNHPSVFGWSFGNELFALFLYDDAAKRDQDRFYDMIIEFGKRSRPLDPTRAFVTCDGDEDLRGTLPIWSKHFAHGLHPLPEGLNKPLVVGESGGTYYARPSQLTEFCGEEAYRSYAGRNRALGVDVYQNIRYMGKRLAYFSPSELTWFGLEPLPYGYNDFTRLPDERDGVFLPRPEEGTPGLYFERIPPFCGTINPDWDKTLPAYRPLDMFYGMRDALTYDKQYDATWERHIPTLPAPPAYDATRSVRFVGDLGGEAAKMLITAGLRFAAESDAVIVDAATADADEATAALQAGGTTLVLLGDTLPAWLPVTATLTDRTATQLDRAAAHPYVDSLSIEDMYTAESREDRLICRHGLEVADATVLLTAGEADWSQFNNVAERAKCGATFLYEKLQKPAGAVLVQLPHDGGEWLLSTVSLTNDEAHRHFWRRLCENLGWTLGDELAADEAVEAVHDLLLNGPVD